MNCSFYNAILQNIATQYNTKGKEKLKMAKNEYQSETSLLMTRENFYKYIGCGRIMGDSIAQAAGAERRIGRRVMIYKPAIDQYLAEPANTNN